MKILIDIPEESIRYANEIPNTYCKWLLSHNDIVRAVKLGTPIPDNATNGDMIKVMFPNAEFDNAMPFTDNRWETIDLDTKSKYKPTQLRVYADWWNAPYKRG